MILAIDPATVTGWCSGEPGGSLAFGRLRLGPPGCGLGVFAGSVCKWLRPLLERLRPSDLIYEKPYIPQPRQFRPGKIITAADSAPPMNGETVQKLMLLAGLIEMCAYDAGIYSPLSVAAPTVAKYFTGRGKWGDRAAKKQTTIAIAQRYGFAVKTDDEADAVAIWLYGESLLYPEAALRRKDGPLFAGGTDG